MMQPEQEEQFLALPFERPWCFFILFPNYATYSADAYELMGEAEDTASFWKAFDRFPGPVDMFASQQRGKVPMNDKVADGFAVFQRGCLPLWEDPQNAEGGHWEVTGFTDLAVLGECWCMLVLSLVGETLEMGLCISGCRVVDRTKRRSPAYRLEVWLRTKDAQYVGHVEERILDLLSNHTTEEIALQWKEH